MRFFFFGTLRDFDVLELVVDRPAHELAISEAYLPAHRTVRLRRDPFPILIAEPDSRAEGIVVEGLTSADLDRIHFFESVEYRASEVTPILSHSGERVSAQVFAGSGRAFHDNEPWHIDDWRRRHKMTMLRESRLWMALYGHLDLAEADRLWDKALAEGRPLEEMVTEIVGPRVRLLG